MTDPRVARLLDDLRLGSEYNFELVSAARRLIQRTIKDATEEVKYGGILFAAPGRPHCCGLFAYAAHVTLEFGQGASLPDEYGLLSGSGKLRRHLKLRRLEDLEGQRVEHYVRLAAAAAAGKEA
ncbi:DUF1801 domain-containing protein [Roseateles sp. DAIF2]|uniref:DUF1801 domain-containing protein n=1 Tax=Roseateles sp. DAIF2 TaxID=2714952 RepID=UPI0018A2860A|nr:DUF1801 domain-containing protein [Roseateles sp. DAIF2]QPF75492.1 DUF1801 domain-containing protein [Roseateles sp. DAIF2]